MIKSKIVRISEELDEEIKRVSNLNGEKYTTASKNIARVLRRNRNKKIKFEDIIKF